MPKVRFEIAINPCDLCEHGGDDIEFLIATNPGEPLLPLSKIASGGELSRMMLALRSVLNDHDGVDTVIFDEIDTGVSGKTSRKIGIKLKETAKGGTQVLCVTHSAQIASLADNHYRITKHERDGRAETDVQLLNTDERVDEIARILGSIEPTEAQRNAAREMIEEYR
jgi:DNA repair protein RecN (Recombination protein N)